MIVMDSSSRIYAFCISLLAFLFAGSTAFAKESVRHFNDQQLTIAMKALSEYAEFESLLESKTPELVTPTSNKKTVVNKKTPKQKVAKVRYCLGGDYDALAKKAKQYDASIAKYSKKYGVSKALIKAIITAESCFNAKAVSPKGAQGLMQLMPPTAKRFGVTDSFNTDLNIKAGTNYLKFLLGYFKEDMLNVIAAYNAGEGAVNKYHGVPPYKETKNYVRKVSALYKLYAQDGVVISRSSVARVSPSLAKTIFVPRALPKSRFSPYKGRAKNISHGNCANRTGTRLRKSTRVDGGNGIWQRIYVAQNGDTLLRVMQRTGIHKNKIMQMNGLRSRERLKAGQELLVWECRK